MAKSQQTLAAERKLADILGMIHYDTSSLTHALVKAFRSGMDKESGRKAFVLIQTAASEALQAYEVAVAQPENKMAARPVVNL